ncbi:predicted protein [Nematostella vectensis]|uniref:Uncharacterized protein n=1 Tax=Nematostella vectensis TaxID=45351 RepID=A7RHA5_NEMVE|nr:predicted protein [Nematostella vectensis]|eukprot:XP_001641255.1 predicted protein [Nematostella vectensis]
MALKNTVTLTENPFENAVIWEKRDPVKESKHRLRHTKNGDKIDTIAIGKDEDSDEYDYCILKAATKGSNPLPRILPSDREIRTHISSSSYNTFAKRHTGGPVYSVSARTVTRTPVSPTSSSCKHSDLSARIRTNANQGKQSVDEEDVQLFCCGRTVESLVDTATCMCCVKGSTEAHMRYEVDVYSSVFNISAMYTMLFPGKRLPSATHLATQDVGLSLLDVVTLITGGPPKIRSESPSKNLHDSYGYLGY